MRHDDVPNNVSLHSEVLVDEDVAESSDLGPSDLWVRIPYLSREMIRSLSDDLQVTFNGVLSHQDKV